MNSDPHQFRRLITLVSPDIVVFEMCTVAGMRDVMEVNYVVENPRGEVWR